MLNQDIEKINIEGGVVSGVEGMFEGKMGSAKAQYVIASPSYIQNVGMGDKLKKTGKIIKRT